jgi:hypothetical protein
VVLLTHLNLIFFEWVVPLSEGLLATVATRAIRGASMLIHVRRLAMMVAMMVAIKRA